MRVRKIAAPLAAATLLSVPVPASAAFVHVVAPGESLSSIAAIDGLTVAQLAGANELSPTAELIAGSQLVIPPQGAPSEVVAGAGAPESATAGAPESATAGAPESATAGASTESATAVAPVEASTAVAPRADDDEDADDGVASATAAGSQPVGPASAAAAGSQPVGAAAEGASGGPPYPTQQSVSPSQVASIASANGVPASLADAIAYMESGFNNGLVSSANARGVMQITPGTWSWIDRTLAGPEGLSPESALDNVRGGVLLLRSLLEATGGDETLAVAGYYQGLPSVLQNGMYSSTRQYVDDVQALQQRFAGG